MGPFAITESRSDVVDFATYLSSDFIQLVVAEKAPELNPWGFLLPYSLWLWIGIFSSLLTMACLFRLFTANSIYRTLYQAFGMSVDQGLSEYMMKII